MARYQDGNNIQKLSFEEASKELEDIIQQLESGNIELEEAIKYYNRGSLLQAHCEKKLKEAQLKVDRIVEEAGIAKSISAAKELSE